MAHHGRGDNGMMLHPVGFWAVTGAFTVDVSGITGVDAADTLATVYAGITFKDDGSIYKRDGSSSSFNSGENWGTPNSAGEGSNYWVRCTKTAGDGPTSGTTGSWIAISTEPEWYNADVDPSGAVFTEGTFTFDISSDASGTPIVGTKTGLVLKANRVP